MCFHVTKIVFRKKAIYMDGSPAAEAEEAEATKETDPTTTGFFFVLL